MNYLFLALGLLAAAALYLFARPRKDSAPPARPTPASVAIAKPASQAPPVPTPAVAPPDAKPALRSIVRTANPLVEDMLKTFPLVRSADLPAQEVQAIGALLGQIPRPPSALHKLVSPVFLAQASTSELSDMVVAEPRVAAKVLAMVNSPLYGLKTPLGSIGQAVTFLGMNSVRSICLQYLLDESFRSDDPEVKRVFDSLWSASAFASELCAKLAQQLQLPEPGTLVTHVVLSFLGHVASHSLLPAKVVIPMMTRGLLERSRVEQEALGLCAAEIGSLLMQQWELPQSISERVRAIDLVLFTPCEQAPSEQASAMAFCYFCARMGEKLARDELRDLAAFRIDQEAGPEFFHLQGYMQLPALARLNDALKAPELVSAINTMAHAMKMRR